MSQTHTFLKTEIALVYRTRLEVKNSCKINYLSQYSKATPHYRNPCVMGGLFMHVYLHFYSDCILLILECWDLTEVYILIIWWSTGILKMHSNLLRRMNIPWSLEDHTAPVTVESACRNCRNFLVGSLKGQSKLNSLFSLRWFRPSTVCWNQWARVEWQHHAWCCKGWTMPSALKFYCSCTV